MRTAESRLSMAAAADDRVRMWHAVGKYTDQATFGLFSPEFGILCDKALVQYQRLFSLDFAGSALATNGGIMKIPL